MQIRIIVVGGLKELYLQQGVQNYLQKLNQTWSVSVEEIPEEKIPDKAGAAEIDQGIKKETLKIVSVLRNDQRIILLAIEGASLSTEKLREKLEEMSDGSRIPITIIIGGSNGVDRGLLPIKTFPLSFSRMTFPHQLMRLILMEQLHRVMML